MLNVVDDLEKIKIIDKAFVSLGVDDVMQLFGADAVVEKLKGTPDRAGPVMQIANELQRIANDAMMLRSECQMLKNDIQILVRCLNKGMGDSAVSSDFNSLKNRHGIY